MSQADYDSAEHGSALRPLVRYNEWAIPEANRINKIAEFHLGHRRTDISFYIQPVFLKKGNTD